MKIGLKKDYEVRGKTRQLSSSSAQGKHMGKQFLAHGERRGIGSGVRLWGCGLRPKENQKPAISDQAPHKGEANKGPCWLVPTPHNVTESSDSIFCFLAKKPF